jgi:hypothetical protein
VYPTYGPEEDADMMAIGTERDAANHVGLESYDGEFARFLIWERPLADAELKQALGALDSVYFRPPSTAMHRRSGSGTGAPARFPGERQLNGPASTEPPIPYSNLLGRWMSPLKKAGGRFTPLPLPRNSGVSAPGSVR